MEARSPGRQAMKEPISEWNMYDKVKIFEAARQAIYNACNCIEMAKPDEKTLKMIANSAARVEIINQKMAFAAMDDQLMAEYERCKLLNKDENEPIQN